VPAVAVAFLVSLGVIFVAASAALFFVAFGFALLAEGVRA
jgi:hypothetical protein